MLKVINGPHETSLYTLLIGSCKFRPI